MTFPRRLTPSDKERATIVQQRMTPGGALGVGSRHVRSGNSPAVSNTQAAGGEPGPLGSLYNVDPTFNRTATTFLIDPSASNNSAGDLTGMAYDATGPGYEISEAGWYQALARIVVGGTPTADISLALAVPGAGSEAGAFRPHGANWQSLTAASIPFYMADGDLPGEVTAQVFNPGGDTIASCAMQLVRLS